MNGVTLQLRQRGNKSGREDDAEPSWVQQRDESARVLPVHRPGERALLGVHCGVGAGGVAVALVVSDGKVVDGLIVVEGVWSSVRQTRLAAPAAAR
eukprot:ctg_1623.g525